MNTICFAVQSNFNFKRSQSKIETMKKLVKNSKTSKFINFYFFFRIILISILFEVLRFIGVVNGKEVNCEKVWDDFWIVSDQGRRLKTCDMHLLTKIDDSNVTISKQKDEISIIFLSTNKKISYLPVEVFQKFPHIIIYRASETSIKAISKKNFRNLNKLQVLYLQRNQIETIHYDTFQDLGNLIELHLGE